MILDLRTCVSSLELIQNTTLYLTFYSYNTLTDLQNNAFNLASYNKIIYGVNPNSTADINHGVNYLTIRNQITDWIEIAYATAVVSKQII